MTEQEMVDGLNSLKAPHYQSHSGKIDPCGHQDCTYHGICILTEFRQFMTDEEIMIRIETSEPISRESMCHCMHRCKSVEFAGKHTGYMSQRNEDDLCPCQR